MTTMVLRLQYFTMWSNILFYVVLIWILLGKVHSDLAPPTWIVDAVMANMIMVGLVGNLLVITNNSNIVAALQREHPDMNVAKLERTIALFNFAKHTLPMVIAAVIFYGNFGRGSSRPGVSIVLLFLLGFAWLVIPFRGHTFYGKFQEVYVDPPPWLFSAPIVGWVFLLASKYAVVART